MKTYLSDLIPKIQRFSQKLDDITKLTNKPWVVINDIDNTKVVYIFRQSGELLISQDGRVEKAKWEYLGFNSLLIDLKNESYLFKQGFFDDSILALKIDNKNEYAFLVNESNFEKELNSSSRVIEFLRTKYIEQNVDINSLPSYVAPEYQIKKTGERHPILGNKKDVYLVKFIDGEEGEVFLNLDDNQAYFKDALSLAWATQKHYYQNLDFCINSLHHFLKTGERLNEGYIVSYS